MTLASVGPTSGSAEVARLARHHRLGQLAHLADHSVGVARRSNRLLDHGAPPVVEFTTLAGAAAANKTLRRSARRWSTRTSLDA